MPNILIQVFFVAITNCWITWTVTTSITLTSYPKADDIFTFRSKTENAAVVSFTDTCGDWGCRGGSCWEWLMIGVGWGVGSRRGAITLVVPLRWSQGVAPRPARRTWPGRQPPRAAGRKWSTSSPRCSEFSEAVGPRAHAVASDPLGNLHEWRVILSGYPKE